MSDTNTEQVIGEILETIQTKEKLNNVHRLGEVGPGGAYHDYLIMPIDSDLDLDADDAIDLTEAGAVLVSFQKGPRKEASSRHGCLDSDLLEIVRDRMKSFQAGPFASNYNRIALEHIEFALEALNQRVEDRINRGVLGENKA